jgi:hypothetical protein
MKVKYNFLFLVVFALAGLLAVGGLTSCDNGSTEEPDVKFLGSESVDLSDVGMGVYIYYFYKIRDIESEGGASFFSELSADLSARTGYYIVGQTVPTIPNYGLSSSVKSAMSRKGANLCAAIIYGQEANGSAYHYYCVVNSLTSSGYTYAEFIVSE